MKKRLTALLLIIAFCSNYNRAQFTIHTIGDSTMEQKATDSISNPNGQRGWSQMLTQFVINGAVINDRAKSGTSSKTFYEEKDSYGNYRFWPTVKPQIKTGDYVLIQFGHNDEKDGGWQSSQNGAVYTGIGTNPWEQYTNYLKAYVNEVRALGAIPILMTPIVRNGWTGTSISASSAHNIGTDSIGRPIDYPAAMRKVATDMSCALVDHTLLTKAYCEQIGQSQTTSLIYNVGDGTHLGIFGATTYARLAVKELIRQGLLTNYLNANPDLLLSSPALNYGKCYPNASSVFQESISGTDLTPAEGSVNISAPNGYYLSTKQTGTYTQTLSLNYTLGTVNLTTIYVKFNPNSVGIYNDSISFVYGTKTKKVAVKGECVSLAGGSKAQAYWELIANQDAVSSGPITVIPETFSNMILQNYATPGSTTTWTGGVVAGTTKTQRNVITGSNWPAGDIDIVNNRYMQFGVTALQGTTFDIDSIGLYGGGAGGSGMRFKVYISKDSLFSNPDVTTMIGDRGTIANASNTMYPVTYNKLTGLAAGESLFLRVFPWYSSAASGKTICLYGVLIKGVVSTVSGVKNVSASPLNVFCYPTKTNSKTTLSYKLPRHSDVSISVKSIDGKTILNINKKNQEADTYKQNIDMSSVPAGVYFCSVMSGADNATVKLIRQ
ncbi:MAG: GDSL-type esterase/lipase family protein [Paludibacter sp.]|nr:GDSL-type esterase/lipase family protein [Paludibacter sp.]